MALQGRLWRTTERGVLLNDARREAIQPEFQPVLDAVVAACLEHGEDDIHSIYVTGSVARGLALPGISDINVFAVLEHHLDPELVMQDWIPLAEERLLKAHPVVSDIKIDLLPQGSIFRDPDEFSISAFIIATHSVCMWGADLTPEMPVYNLNDVDTRLGIANDDILQMMPDIDDAWNSIQADRTPENVRDWCRFICKNIIHSAFSLTREQEVAHTRDIDVALGYINRYYPEQVDAMAQAADWIRQPMDDAETLLDFLESHGEWMIDRCEDWLDAHNPDRRECYFTGDDEETD